MAACHTAAANCRSVSRRFRPAGWPIRSLKSPAHPAQSMPWIALTASSSMGKVRWLWNQTTLLAGQVFRQCARDPRRVGLRHHEGHLDILAVHGADEAGVELQVQPVEDADGECLDRLELVAVRRFRCGIVPMARTLQAPLPVLLAGLSADGRDHRVDHAPLGRWRAAGVVRVDAVYVLGVPLVAAGLQRRGKRGKGRHLGLGH